MSNNIKLKHAIIDLPFDKAKSVQVIAVYGKNNIVGAAAVDYWGEGVGTYPIISKVWVDPVFRRRGIARQMMDYVIDLAVKQSIESLALYAVKDNAHARALYESLGFFAASKSGENIFYALNLKSK